MQFPHAGLRHQQRGSYLVWMLILIPAIAGWLGISIDAGFALSEKNRAQAAADAAAIAAVLTVNNNGSYEEAQAAATSALADNGFTGTVTVGNNDKNSSHPHSPTQAQSNFFCETCPGYQDKYVGVTVTTQSPMLINTWYGDGNLSLTAHAVARAEKADADSECPGIYASSGNKSTNLLQGSDFTILGGGIFIEVPPGTKSLYGSNGGKDNPAVLSANWIELPGAEGSTVGSVTFNPPPTDLSMDRETPDPAPTGLVNYPNCILEGGDFKCQCTEKGGKYDCKEDRPDTKTLTAGNYIGGLKIINTKNVILAPVGSTEEERSLLKNLYFKMTSGDLLIEKNSTVSGQNILIDARSDGAELSIILKDASVLDVTARLYANSFYLDQDSDIIVTVYTGDQDREGEYFVCGKKPTLNPTLLH